MSIGIYKITNPNNRVYIGQSNNLTYRFDQYRKYLDCSRQPRLYNSFIKYGVENHIFDIVEECEIKDLNIRERFWQEFYDVISPNGLNCQLVDAESEPRVFSQETREKMSQSAKNKKWTEEHKTRFKLNRVGRDKKVINTETGEVFKSIKEAAKSIGMKYTTLACKLLGQSTNTTKIEYYEP